VTSPSGRTTTRRPRRKASVKSCRTSTSRYRRVGAGRCPRVRAGCGQAVAGGLSGQVQPEVSENVSVV
jgi:hypothetical protein